MASGCVRDVFGMCLNIRLAGRLVVVNADIKPHDHHYNAISLKGLHHSGGRVVEIFLKTEFSVCQLVRYPTRWE